MKAIGSHCNRWFRSGRKVWTAAELARLDRIYPDATGRELTRAFHRPIGKIYQAAQRRGLHKSDAFLANRKLSGRFDKLCRAGERFRFPKGHVPQNKGLRRPGWSPGRMAETQFKKGRPAHEARNYVPIGTEKIDPKRNVLMRKITDDPTIFPVKRWRPVHVIVWESAHGPIPAGHICVFRPGMKTFDRDLITADRLEVVTLAENMRRNSFHNRYPKEIGLLIQARGALVRSINRRSRPHGNR